MTTAISGYLNRPLRTEEQARLETGPLPLEAVLDLCRLADRLDVYAVQCDGGYPDSYIGRAQLQSEAASLRTLIAMSFPEALRVHEARHARNRYESAMRRAVVGQVVSRRK